MRLSRNVVVLGIVSLLADVSSDMVVPLLPAFIVTLGGGAAFIGLIEGVAEAASALLKYASGSWAGSEGRTHQNRPPAGPGFAAASSSSPAVRASMR